MGSSKLAALAALLAGCASVSSTVRSEVPDASATVTFQADLHAGSGPWLVFDEHGRYLGSLVGRSRFVARVEPGRHVFAAAPVLSSSEECVAVVEVLDPGSRSETWLAEDPGRGREGIGDTVLGASMLERGAGQRLVGAMVPAAACPRMGRVAMLERR